MKDWVDIVGLCLIVTMAMLLGGAIANRHPDMSMCKKMIEISIGAAAKETQTPTDEIWDLGAKSRFWDIREMCLFLPDLKGPYETVYFSLAGRDYICEQAK